MDTLETDLGLSPALLAALGTRHTCVTPVQAEVDRLTAYCEAHEIDSHAVRFIVGPVRHGAARARRR